MRMPANNVARQHSVPAHYPLIALRMRMQCLKRGRQVPGQGLRMGRSITLLCTYTYQHVIRNFSERAGGGRCGLAQLHFQLHFYMCHRLLLEV